MTTTGFVPAKTFHPVGDFKPVSEVEMPDGMRVFIGSDSKLYRKTNSLMPAIVPVVSPEKDKTRVYLDDIQWGEFPPMAELVHLYRTLLSKYSREVMFLIGRRFDKKGWVYVLPQQIGTVGSVSWKDEEAAGKLAEVATFVGTAHSHPGESAHPSGTDTNDWETPSKSGLHIIFGRTGEYTISGSVAGHTVVLQKGVIPMDAPMTEVPLELYGRKLEDLLKEPPKEEKGRLLKFFGSGSRHKKKYHNQHRKAFNWDKWEEERNRRDCEASGISLDIDDTSSVLGGVGALVCTPREMDELLTVRYDGLVYLLTIAQWRQACREARICNIRLPKPTRVVRSVVRLEAGK